MSKPNAAEKAASDAYRKAVDERRIGDVWVDVVTAVREQIAQERRIIDRFPEIVEEYGAELVPLGSDAGRIGRALVSAARVVRGEQP